MLIIPPQSIIPPSWGWFYADRRETLAADDLLALGRATLLAMVRDWEGERQTLHDELKRLDFLHDTVSGKTVEDLREVAATYKNPEISRPDTPQPEVEINSGQTTFNRCGWCWYSDERTRRVAYGKVGKVILNPSCELITEAGLADTARTYSTPCSLTGRDGGDLVEKIQRGLQSRLTETALLENHASSRQRYAQAMADQAVEKPLLPGARPSKHAARGTVLLAYVPDWDKRELPDPFVMTEVLDDPLPQWPDGMAPVTVNPKAFSEAVPAESSGRWYIWVYAAATFSLAEYHYLRDHPEFGELWAEEGLAPLIPEFDSERFKKALEIARSTR